ncbi:MAG TPA: UDP-N-acetylmuramoyl-L-alanyl-D-glutamate--2,6-diaminopimelate ligase [Dehalococcoidia bacterium]|nr:UDP-N-acetylmuramoyl-L-alanyl-D-glutamate--2,6-diaminopimelate ligase [Dehalococcoidia bacterium]
MVDRRLPALLQATAVRDHAGPTSAEPLTGITQDSRAVTPGACFVAVPGFTVDGHAFLDAALANGAGALVVQEDRSSAWQRLLPNPTVPLVVVPDARAALADLAAAFHDFPARKLTVIGITGTDGKTTTSYLTRSILEAAGHSAGLIGGVQFKVGDEWRWNTLTQTSPEADLIQRLLSEMVNAGQTHVVMEATSHGLSLHRLDHCEFDVAVFTGLSDDHLDFHLTREAYLDTKLNLFRALTTSAQKDIPKTAVFFHDETHAPAIHEAIIGPHPNAVGTVTLGFENTGSDISTSDIQASATGSSFRIVTPGGAFATQVHMPGRFNLRNALTATGAAWAVGAPIGSIAQGLAAVQGVPGRMERIDAGQPFTVVVDAAATGAALRTVLESVRPLVTGRLITVFGCAGERDPERGREMGRAAAALADYSILTNENPRSADSVELVRDIARTMEGAGAVSGSSFEEQPDRRAAIARAFDLAKPDDFVLIAGKGAEQTMIYAEHTDPWDDREVARELLET